MIGPNSKLSWTAKSLDVFFVASLAEIGQPQNDENEEGAKRLSHLLSFLLKQKQTIFLTIKNGHTYKYLRKSMHSAIPFTETETGDRPEP